MNITVFRMDDRLVHGQIVTAWANYAEANQIVVVDDKVAKDNLRQTLLRMATPKTINLKVIDTETAKNFFKEEDSYKTLLLVGDVDTALKIVDYIPNLKEINIGNQNMKKGKIKILDNFWVFNDEVEKFYLIESKGIICEFRTVPNDKSLNICKLLKEKIGK